MNNTTPPTQEARRSLRELLRSDLGFVPVLITLVLIALFFQVLTDGVFLQARNLSNLSLQVVTVGIVSIAAVLVLLLGEIDLSLSAAAGACSAVMAVLLVRQGWDPILAILAGILSGTLIGLFNGFFVAVLRIPSFIVTLAGSIAYAGFLLLVLAPQTTLSIRNETITSITSNYLPTELGIGLPVLGLLIYAGLQYRNRLIRQQAGLQVPPMSQFGLKIGSIALVMIIIVAGFQSYLGVPQSAAIWIGLVIFFWILLKQTAFGRHIYAVGGNPEAARRAGINVIGLRIAVFALASTLAAVAGLMQASRGTGVAAQLSPTLLLNAIAAAVIGGVSLFGGRGSVWAVVLGSLVIGSLENGLDLLNQGQDVKNIVQGVVLLLAVTVDAILRRANNTSSR